MEELRMGVRDARRLGAVEAAIQGRISNEEGARRSGVSVRQFKRLRAKVRGQGPAGLVHGNRGRVSKRRLAGATRQAVEALLQHAELRFNDCHIRDLVAEQGHRVSAESIRLIRLELGLPSKKRRRPARYHRRRLREAQRGAMVQVDGSSFHWFGREQPMCCLIGMVDDATGEILSLCFRPNEDLHGYVTALRDLIQGEGVPLCLYGDRTGIAVRNDPHWTREEELVGRRTSTQFGQILEELGIRYIAAHTPEAKGRVERAWQTLQDRLVVELALHGIRTAQAAHDFLPHFLARYRAWFAASPREVTNAFVRPPRHLDRILACRYDRTVARDNTISIGGCLVQLPPGSHLRSRFGTKVQVRELLDGRLLVLHRGQVLVEHAAPSSEFELVPRRDVARASKRSSDPRPVAAPRVRRPATRSIRGSGRPQSEQHPWKKASVFGTRNRAEGRRG